MTIRNLVLALVAVAFVAVVPSLGAQSMPATTTAKNAARRVAAATNEHIRAMQDVDGATRPVTPPKPASRMVAAPKAVAPSAAGRAAARATTRKAPAPPPAKAAAPDTAGPGNAAAGSDHATSVSEHSKHNELSLMRETFSYNADGRRDPFVSLITSGELRPMVSDLRLVTVVFDPGGRSVAVLRDVSTKEQYRIRAGQTLGRMRVARIDPKSVTFTLEEFGYSRQETLALNDSTRARSQ